MSPPLKEKEFLHVPSNPSTSLLRGCSFSNVLKSLGVEGAVVTVLISIKSRNEVKAGSKVNWA